MGPDVIKADSYVPVVPPVRYKQAAPLSGVGWGLYGPAPTCSPLMTPPDLSAPCTQGQ